MSRRTFCVLVAVVSAGLAVSAQSLDDKIKQLTSQIEQAQRQVEALTPSLAGLSGDGAIRLNNRLFTTLFDQLRALPSDQRRVSIQATKVEGDLAKFRSIFVPMSLCGWRFRIEDNQYRATGKVDLTALTWLGAGRARVSTRVTADATVRVEVIMTTIPFPDIECHIETDHVCTKVLWYEVCADLPRPVCEFRGWRPCSEGTFLGEQRKGGLTAKGQVSEDFDFVVNLGEFGTLPKDITRVLRRVPTSSPAQIAAQLNVPTASVETSLLKLRSAALVKKDSGELEEKGKDFSIGAGHWLSVDAVAERPLPIRLFVHDIQMPDPFTHIEDLYCSKYRAFLLPWCLLNDLVRPLAKPLHKLGFPLTLPPVRLDDRAETLPSPLFATADPVEIVHSDPVGLSTPAPPVPTNSTYFDPFTNRSVNIDVTMAGLELPQEAVIVPLWARSEWSDISAVSRYFKMHFVDVGLGDAVWLHTPRHPDGSGEQHLIIDGGPDVNTRGADPHGNRLMTYLNRFGYSTGRVVDYVVITHPEKDNFEGMLDILKSYEVKNIVVPGCGKGSRSFRAFLKRAKEEKVGNTASAVAEVCGQLPVFSIGTDSKAEVAYSLASPADSNRQSIVVKVVYGNMSLLVMDGARLPVEQSLLSQGGSLKNSVLRAGDHASQSTNSSAFLRAVGPDVVVVSAGVGQVSGAVVPDSAVIARMAATLPTAAVLRTDNADQSEGLNVWSDFDGDDVVVLSDGDVLVAYHAVLTQGKREWSRISP